MCNSVPLDLTPSFGLCGHQALTWYLQRHMQVAHAYTEFFLKFLKIIKKFERINKKKGQTLSKQISCTEMMNGNGGAISKEGLKRYRPKSQPA